MHPIQELIIRNMNRPEVIAEALTNASAEAVDAAFMVVGLLEQKGEREAARGLALAVAAGLSRSRARDAERLEASARKLAGPRRLSPAQPASGVSLSALYVPKRFG